jgi:hypothetical protein
MVRFGGKVTKLRLEQSVLWLDTTFGTLPGQERLDHKAFKI